MECASLREAGGMNALLEVRDLRTHFRVEGGDFAAVDGVSFSVQAGRTLGIVGESGCGKSVTALSIMGLIQQPPGRIAGGEIRFEGRRIDNLPYEEMRKVRGRHIGAIFQDPLTSLNPLYTVGQQLEETILTHLEMNRSAARERALQLLGDWLRDALNPKLR